MPEARNWRSFAAFLALAMEIACASDSIGPGGKARPNPRAECRNSFAACAPPVRFDERTDVSKLTTRNLVNVAARLDVPDKLAKKAASRLLKIAMEAQQPELLEIEAAVDDTTTILRPCSCGDRFKSELDKQGIAGLVKSRLPSREQRSPELWAERVLADLAAIQQLTRSSAVLALGGATEGAAGTAARDAQMRELQKKLCMTVHGARAALQPEAFAAALDIVNRKEIAGVGEGSAAVARRMLDEHQAATSCDAEEPPQGEGDPAP